VTSQVSSSIAALILIAALPLNADPAQQSVYQSMVETYHQDHPTIDDMDLDSLTEAIRTTLLIAKVRHLRAKIELERATFWSN